MFDGVLDMILGQKRSEVSLALIELVVGFNKGLLLVASLGSNE